MICKIHLKISIGSCCHTPHGRGWIRQPPCLGCKSGAAQVQYRPNTPKRCPPVSFLCCVKKRVGHSSHGAETAPVPSAIQAAPGSIQRREICLTLPLMPECPAGSGTASRRAHPVLTSVPRPCTTACIWADDTPGRSTLRRCWTVPRSAERRRISCYARPLSAPRRAVYAPQYAGRARNRAGASVARR